MTFMTIYFDWFDLEVSLDDLLDTILVYLYYPNWIVILFLIFLLESNMLLTTYEVF